MGLFGIGRKRENKKTGAEGIMNEAGEQGLQDSPAQAVQSASGSENDRQQDEKAAKRRRRQIREIRSFFIRLAGLSIFIYVIFFWVFGLKSMPNDDMKPRISAGDLMLYYRMERKYYPGDVVIAVKDGREYVGRIVALPGDEVDIPDGGGLRINGNSVLESEIYYPTGAYETDKISYPCSLSGEEFFLLCDYRAGAKDSRFYGTVSRTELKGKVITVLRRSKL